MSKFPTIDNGSEPGSWEQARRFNPGGALTVLGDDLDREFTEYRDPSGASRRDGESSPSSPASPSHPVSHPFHEADNAD